MPAKRAGRCGIRRSGRCRWLSGRGRFRRGSQGRERRRGRGCSGVRCGSGPRRARRRRRARRAGARGGLRCRRTAGRRSRGRGRKVVGIFPDDDAIVRFVGAILLEQNDEWAVQRARYMTLETIAALSDDPIVGLPANVVGRGIEPALTRWWVHRRGGSRSRYDRCRRSKSLSSTKCCWF